MRKRDQFLHTKPITRNQFFRYRVVRCLISDLISDLNTCLIRYAVLIPTNNQ